MIKITLLIIMLASSTLSYAEPKQPAIVTSGFLTGNQFRALNPFEKSGYAMGFLDGVYMSPMFGASQEELQWIEGCIGGVGRGKKGMTNEKVVAIFEKFLNENPALWNLPMNCLAFDAMEKGCKK